MSESPIQDTRKPEEVARFQAQFEALDIPRNIDPYLLALWVQREQDEINRKQRKHIPPPQKWGRNLNLLFAAYIGIAVMCLSVILGLIQQREPTVILQTTCIVFLIYTVIGFFVGIIAEHCVADSVETLLRDIVNRSREAGRQPVNKEEIE